MAMGSHEMIRTSLLLSTLAILAAPAVSEAQAVKSEDIPERLMNSTAFVVAPVPRSSNIFATGSGALIVNQPNRRNPAQSQILVLTNYHVVAKLGNDVRVMFPVKDQRGQVISEREKYINRVVDPEYSCDGKVIALDEVRDLAIVKLNVAALPGHLQALPVAAKPPARGATVHTLGNPGAGSMWSYTRGVVKGLQERSFPPQQGFGPMQFRVIEADNTINSGDSGGPLVNDRGELVGITQGAITNTAGTVRGISIFISVEEVHELLKASKIALPRTPAIATRPKPTPPSADAEKSAKASEDPKAAAEKAATTKLKRAKTFLDEGQTNHAKEYLEEIVVKYAETIAAEEAKDLLKKLKK